MRLKTTLLRKQGLRLARCRSTVFVQRLEEMNLPTEMRDLFAPLGEMLSGLCEQF